MTTNITGGDHRPLQRKTVRSDGWTKTRRQQFIDALAHSCNVTLAAEAADMSSSGAYQLRRRDPAFAALWKEALAIGYERLEEALLSRALVGVNAIVIDGGADENGGSGERGGHGERGADGAKVLPGSGFTARPVGSGDVQLALALLNRRRAAGDDVGAPRGRHRRPTADEVDALLTKKLDALARRVAAAISA